MAPQKMLYIKEEDQELIEKAQLCSKENFSNTVIRALKWYVDSQQDIKFELQAVIIGFECAFEYPFGSRQVVPEELHEDAAAHGNLVFDELLPRVFPKTKITFFGAEIFYSEENATIRGIPGLRLHENIIVNAYEGNFNNKEYIDALNTDDFDDWHLAEDQPIMHANVKLTVFRTRGDKFLILANISGLDELRKLDSDAHYIPDPSDYVVIDKLDEKYNSITTETYKIEIELPKNFIRKVLAADESASNEKHLDV